MLDRLATLVPDWKERRPADLGIVLVELLAYVADRLSYEQDARNAEGYLATARKRRSVRRLARLVDYSMHDGANARVWARLEVRGDISGLTLQPKFDVAGPGGAVQAVPARFLTRVPGVSVVLAAGSAAYDQALQARTEVFEPLEPVTLDAAHNELNFYDWGDEDCCLPRGATAATLRGAYPNLTEGATLIFAESLGPHSGAAADADLSRRHAVRLLSVRASSDPLGGRFESPPHDGAVAVTEIEWGAADALPFALTISSRTDQGYFRDVSVAWGNICLADHGRTLDEAEELPRVPDSEPALAAVVAAGSERCRTVVAAAPPARYRPVLQLRPLTQAAPYDADNPPTSAWEALRPDARAALPELRLIDADSQLEWEPLRDLLASASDAREFVVELASDDRAQLRFGDGAFGARPAAYTRFVARYRVGNGPAGDIGPEALAHIASADPAISSETGPNAVIQRVSNPLPATGGLSPETIEQARRNAPQAFRTQERAVTESDYAAAALRVSADLQRAAAAFRWTGSWHTAFVTADRFEGRPVSASFEQDLRARLERFRMAGHDLEVDAPRPVPLEIRLHICLAPDYFAADVRQDLLAVFSNRMLPDGRRGLFHPDNFTFGQPVYLSPLYAAAQRLDGVAAVKATRFRRQGKPLTSGIDSGMLEMGRLEVAQLENDPNFPERGLFSVVVVEARP